MSDAKTALAAAEAAAASASVASQAAAEAAGLIAEPLDAVLPGKIANPLDPVGAAIAATYMAVDEAPTTPARWTEESDPDNTLGLQRMVNAIKRTPGGRGYLPDALTISDTITIDASVALEGAQRRYTSITQTAPGKHAFLVSRDTGGGETFSRGVTLRNLRLLGPAGSTKSAVHAANDADANAYQGQALDLDLSIKGFDVGVRVHRWDNSVVRGHYESCRLGLHASGNANSNVYEVTATTISEAAVRLGDGMGSTLILHDLINSAQMLDLLALCEVSIIGGNLESCTGAQAFIHIANGAIVRGTPGRFIKGTGTEVPGVLVENGGYLFTGGRPEWSGFTTAKVIRKASNNAIVVGTAPTNNLSVAAQVLVDDVGNMSYPVSMWPVRQENAVPAASVNLRNMLLASLTRDATTGSTAVDKLYFYGKDRTNGADAYVRHVLSGHLEGTGTPEGVVAAPVGTLYTRTDGGAGTTLYVKETGTGNTGWAAK